MPLQKRYRQRPVVSVVLLDVMGLGWVRLVVPPILSSVGLEMFRTTLVGSILIYKCT